MVIFMPKVVEAQEVKFGNTVVNLQGNEWVGNRGNDELRIKYLPTFYTEYPVIRAELSNSKDKSSFTVDFKEMGMTEEWMVQAHWTSNRSDKINPETWIKDVTDFLKNNEANRWLGKMERAAGFESRRLR